MIIPVDPSPGAFPTTRWSVVIDARASSSAEARQALETLCREYWYPLYSFIRRRGHTHEEAEDCTQEFLSRLVAGGAVARVQAERGRFRTFLLTALRHFLINEWNRATAAKRGGGTPGVPIPFDTAERRFAAEPVDPGLTPEQAFDRSWAVGLIGRAMGELREEYEKSGRGSLYVALTPLIQGERGGVRRDEQAAKLGMDTLAFNVALHRLRRRVGQRLRALIAETVCAESDVDAELRELIQAICTP